ncbi:MAG: non-hydrolyzing UDP-N-acetylglucosamine 2-epimerase [Candidatus Polarisedimenticolia bacterium]
MKIVLVAGARPNFVKIAPLLHEMKKSARLRPVLVHTGQHYDDAMSGRFFRDLDIQPPDVNLEVGSGSHAEQTAEVMTRLEPLLSSLEPRLLLVVGDVNSTVAGALTAAKLGISVAHVEAGLRSFDRSMPEEINRVLTDSISDLLFVTEESGLENLVREGIHPERIHFVGNLMIDALQTSRARWQASDIFQRLGLEETTPFAFLTLHRPSNVDDGPTRERLLAAVLELSEILPVLFPVHPRLRDRLSREPVSWLDAQGIDMLPSSGLFGLPPLGYLDCIALMSRARFVMTDSGGIQEETTVLRVPCLTLRENTERPVTVTSGTNIIVGTDPARIVEEALWTLLSRPQAPPAPRLWDGRAAHRIMEVLERLDSVPAASPGQLPRAARAAIRLPRGLVQASRRDLP